MIINKAKIKLKNLPTYVWILLAIFAVGIFLRTFHFHDVLRFNADQARDASIVRDVVDGKISVPLLGPKAGGTDFKLGGAFYYFQIASAKIFGNEPDKMAYPDLLFSILALPLLYLLLIRYFDKKTALGLVAVFAVSVFAIKYSRFAWNPNSTPFWSMLFLYASVKIVSSEKEAWKWAVALGIATGIGVQLHTLLLIFLPIVLVIVFGYLLVKKKKILKSFLIVVAVAVFLNIPQIISESQTGGANVRAFFGGVETKNKKNSVLENVIKNTICYAQGNAYIISGVNVSDTCEIKSVKTTQGAAISFFGLLIFLGGIVAGIRKLKQEKDENRKAFLAVIIFYVVLSFVVLIPLANEISMRFFLVLACMPFVLSGLCLEYIFEKIENKKVALLVAGGLIVILFVSNFSIATTNLSGQLKYTEEAGGSFDNVSLKEIELLSSFIITHGDSREVILDGSPKYVSRIIKPLQYMTDKSTVKLLNQKTKLNEALVFYVGNSNAKEKILKDKVVQDYEVLGRMAIYQIGN